MRPSPPLAARRAGLVLLLLSAAACSGGGGGDACETLLSASGPGRSVVLVVADTLRRDAVEPYGGAAHTPVLELLAREGVVFERSMSQAPWTKPAVATLFTSLYPSQHGLLTHPRTHRGKRPPEGAQREALESTDRLADGFDTLAERYREAGYETAAFVANPWLLGEYGFDQGFDVYDDSFARWDAKGFSVSLAAIRWLEERAGDRPFFLYLHYLDPHLPYGPLDRAETLAMRDEIAADTRPVNAEAAEKIRSQAVFADGGSALAAGVEPRLRLLELAYHKGVEQFDQALGGFLEALEGAGLADSVALVVTADHGESLYTRGFGNHGTSLYEDEVAVPLLMRLPGIEARRSECPVGLVDLMPFLCRYSGLACDAPPGPRVGDGRGGSDAAAPPLQIAEGVGAAPRHRALREGRWKLIWEPDRPDAPEWLLFDLEEDPGETHNLASGSDGDPEAEDAFARLRQALPGAVAPFDAPDRESAPVDPETSRRLEALGYTR